MGLWFCCRQMWGVVWPGIVGASPGSCVSPADISQSFTRTSCQWDITGQNTGRVMCQDVTSAVTSADATVMSPEEAVAPCLHHDDVSWWHTDVSYQVMSPVT